MGLGLITCVEVEEVAGVLIPFGSGAAQVFHVLRIELRLLLVAEVEEGDRQEEGWESREWSRSCQRETTNAHMDGMEMTVKCAQNLSHECECGDQGL